MEERITAVGAPQNGQSHAVHDARRGFHPSSPAAMTVSMAVRITLGLVFLIAGAEKLTALDAFGHAIYNYRILPLSMVNIAALLFVWTEIVAGVLLLAGVAVRGAALVTALLLALFLVAILSAMARGLTIDCGCFVSAKDIAAGGGEKVGWKKVLEDLALLAGGIFLIYYPKSYLSLERLLRERPAAEG